MRKDRIDVIIPAFKAHSTIIRCLSSIACQTIIDDVSVVVCNDCCPEGDYSDAVKMFSTVMDIREIKLPKNSGPGAARQYGIDNTDGEFFTCIDADDALFRVDALELLRREIQTDSTYKCAFGAFKGRGILTKSPERICKNPVWMFGKLYRREFIEKYNIRFNDTRANEDSGFNHCIKLLCDNPEEKIRYVEEYVYLYITRPDSITNIGNGQYYYDQCSCGGIDNMIYAINHAKKYRPFSGTIIQEILGCLMHWYCQYVRLLDKVPSLSIQLWEYIKKYYHTCYKQVEDYIPDNIFRETYSAILSQNIMLGDMVGVIPKISIMEFMKRLHEEKYDPNLINEIREEMEADPEYQELMKNNIACGVCPENIKEADNGLKSDEVQV